MKVRGSRGTLVSAAALVGALAFVQPAFAADYYKGRTVTVVVGLFRFTVLSTLKISARNCRFMLFGRLKLLKMPRLAKRLVGTRSSGTAWRSGYCRASASASPAFTTAWRSATGRGRRLD